MARWFQYPAKTEPVLVETVAAVVAVGFFAAEVIFPRSIIYQAKAEPVAVAEQVTVDKWYEPLSEPVRVKKLATAQQQAYVATEQAPVTAIFPATVTSHFIFPPRTIIYQSQAMPPQQAAEIITEDKWHQPWSEPVRIRELSATQQQSYTAPAGFAPVISFTSIDVTVQFTRLLQYQAKIEPLPIPEVITEGKWHQAWSQPVRIKPKVCFQQDLAWSGHTPAAEINTEDKWHQSWSEPVRVKPKVSFQQSLAWSGHTPAAVTTAVFNTTLTSQVTFPRSISYQSQALPPQQAETIYEDKWHQPWSQPVRIKKAVTQQQFLAWSGHTPQPETITEDKWHQSWSEPVRVKPRVCFQRDLAWSGHTPAAAAAVLNTTLTSQVIFPRSIQYQSLAWCPQTIAAPTVAYFPYVQGDTGLVFQKTIIYQVTAEAESPEINIHWDHPWAEPVRRKNLSAALAQSAGQTLVTITPETITEDKWHQAWSQPVRIRNLATAQQRAHFGPEATIPRVEAIQPTTATSSVTFPRSIIYQTLAWSPRTITPETITEDKWHYPWSEPVRIKQGLSAREQQTLAWCPRTIIPEVNTEDKWHQPWSIPVRTRKLATAQQRAYFGPEATIPNVATPYFPYVQGDTGLTFQKTIIYQVTAEAESPETHIYWDHPWAEPVRRKYNVALTSALTWSGHTPSAEVITEDKWHQAWSQPVSIKKAVTQQQFLAWSGHTPAAEVITEDKWHQPWSDPVRKKPGLAWQQRDLFWSGFTPVLTEDRWHQAWSDPVRVRRFAVAQQQFSAWSSHTPAPEVITEDKWHQAWSIPVKLKKLFGAELQQAFTSSPPVLAIPTNAPWFAPLSEPVRQKVGLSARLQQFFTTDANKPPQPPVFFILDATETNNDSAAFYFALYNPAVRVYVSIKEVPGNDDAYASIEETD